MYVDSEGREVEVDPDESEPAAPKKRQPSTGGSSTRDSGGRSGTARRSRVIEPPSFRRVVRRALLVGPLMYAVIWLTTRDATITNAQRIQQTVILLVLFLPFSYVLDRVMYRAYLRRTGERPPRRGS